MTQQDIAHITHLGRLKDGLGVMVRTLEHRPGLAGLKIEFDPIITSIPECIRNETRDALLAHYRSRLAAVEAEIASITVCYMAEKPAPSHP